MRKIKTIYIAAIICFIILLAPATEASEDANSIVPERLKESLANRTLSEQAQQCIDCHLETKPALVSDWMAGKHHYYKVGCMDCHITDANAGDMSKDHLVYDETPVTAVVSPKDCGKCHASEVEQFAKSKHANTIEIIDKIDIWINFGMNNRIERTTGCYHCHGSTVKITDGQLDKNTWPNVGIGRVNPDGSKGSCSSCHTRHKFSLAEARKPQACGQCHLGPDHPQTEIYAESKHGAIYEAEGHKWNWDDAPKDWQPGDDFRSPTCAVCHMAGINTVSRTHDVTQRLSWETQAALTVRPSDYKPFPAKTDWQKERAKMEKVCLACHSTAWVKGHFERFDNAVANYNETYYAPMKKIVDDLYEKNLLDKGKPFDEPIEVDMYELWHHEGRRARMGAAMMAPDYAWWHGFYELKKRCMAIEQQANGLLQTAKASEKFEIKGPFATPASSDTGEKQLTDKTNHGQVKE